MPERGARPRRAQLHVRRDLAGLVIAAVLSVAFAALVLQIWQTDGAPLAYSGDAPFYEMVVKGILDHGWHLENPSLGAPSGQELYDFPIVSSDNAQAFTIKILGLISSDWTWVVSAYFLLTFVFAAISAYVVLRVFQVEVAPAIVCSVLFSLLPYHFARGASELFLSGYFAVPLGCYLVLSILGGRPLFTRRRSRRSGLVAYTSGRTLGTLTACIVITLAAGSFYYSAFTIMLVAAAAVATAVIRRRPVALATGVLVIGLIVTATVVTAAPSVAYAIRHGSNDVVSKRGSNESEIFALKLTQLVLPIEDHRVGPLRRASASYAETAPFGELGRPVHLGLVGTVGFVWLLVVAVLRVLAPAGVQIGAAYRHLAGATLLAFLLGTIGGVSALIAAVTPQLRAWNRLSIFIGFFALVAVGFALTGLGRRLTYGGGARLAFWGALAAMLVIGVLDQTSTRDARDYDALRAEYASDAAFVREIEKRLPRGAAVLQLPYVPFPEAGLPGKLGDYDHVRPYLHSDTLRWSFGAMKGRPDDWLAPRAGESMELLLPAAVEDGFAGVYVDRRGYEDGGKDVEAAVAKILGGERPLVSANERFVFYDLRDVPGIRTGAG